VLRGLTLRVGVGEVVGLVGRNGAGKSTAMGIASGLVHPDQGQCLLFGVDAWRPEARDGLGVVPESAHFPAHSRVERYLNRLTQLAGGGHTEAALRTCELDDLRHAWLSQLSKGERRRVLWAQALAVSPRLLLLDEPFSGLDAPLRAAMLEAVQGLVERGTAVLATSHRSEDLDVLGARLVPLGDAP
jgi:ABC-2 type transport system ATP-binding protein